MADTAPVMIWISGPDKLATFFNKGWLDFTGRGMEQELGYGWTAGLAPENRAECIRDYQAAFDTQIAWRGEWPLRRSDGEYRWMLCNGAPRFAPDGEFAGYIVSCSDISDLKSIQAASLARQKLESLGVLAGGIAHDFNNLLGSIHAKAEIAEAEGPTGAFPAEEIQAIKGLSIHASEIVRQLMIYAGHEDSDSELQDLSRLVQEMLDLIGISLSKSAVLKTDLAKVLPAVLGNGPQIQQVVMNLVLNASDALDEKGGVIKVSTSQTPGGPVCLEVSDNGPGISTELQARIFDPFFTTKFRGRGLGLAVVLGIVRAHKGEIELSSTPGQGTTFKVLWPAIESSADALEMASAAAASAGIGPVRMQRPHGSILVVEDEEMLRVSVSKMLRKEGFAVIEAADGTAAIEALRDPQRDIDVILLDMTIPGAPSRSVAEEAGRIRPEVKVLLTSAYTREMAGPVGAASQVRGFIRKPFRLRELVDVLRLTLQR
jgi:PAS domain S-box-containing protein